MIEERQATGFDEAVAALGARKDAWARLPIGRKIGYLERARERTVQVAPRWVAAAVAAKGLAPTSPTAGEEWLSGPWVLFALNRLIETLRAVEREGTPHLERGAVCTRPDGQVVVKVFPRSLFDRLLVNGVSAEVWMQPGVTPATLRETMAVFYQRTEPAGSVCLVLGAGNIASIPPLDVLYKLYAEGQVCLLKMNPVNAYLGPFFERIFDALIADGYLRVVYGGAEAGAALCAHAGVDTIHVTGSYRTHDAIVFGGGDEGAARKGRNEPLLDKPISSELGNVSPTIVVPEPWSAADLRYQAEHIATQKMHNAGFNCIAAQVLVLPAEWEQTPALLESLRAVLRGTPPRAPYYPGAAQRQRLFAAQHPEAELFDRPEPGGVPRTLIAGLSPWANDEICFRDEAFGSVLAQTALPGRDAAAFLRAAVSFCNEKLWGTLGANIIVHPRTARALGAELEQAIADLRYGCVGINAWTGVGFLLAPASWGAFPGHTPDDIQSGSGVVHNSLLFDRPQKSVVRAPFYPFPRGLWHGQRALLPKPPWFITNRRGRALGQRLTAFEAAPGFRHLPGIFFDALRG